MLCKLKILLLDNTDVKLIEIKVKKTKLGLLYNFGDGLILSFCRKNEVKFEQMKEESLEKVRRLTGVKRSAFAVMVALLEGAKLLLKSQGGKPNKLSIENRLRMTLEYLREYRTYFHISRSYGMSESTYYLNIHGVEDTLIKSGRFSFIQVRRGDIH